MFWKQQSRQTQPLESHFESSSCFGNHGKTVDALARCDDLFATCISTNTDTEDGFACELGDGDIETEHLDVHFSAVHVASHES